MREGQQVTVRALTAMPGVADGEVRHVPWDARLATLVDAGRYEVLDDGDRPPAAVVVDGGEPAGDVDEPPATAAAGDVDGEPTARRARRR
ncbi:hypothetical protein GA0070610_1764 [Micromonospora echinofusca]|uniref:Uncharacterized protein n=1 Tax=Micromonospora echinofusca TaxID=47858 RepID=A0A1C5G719_MICEH|nr:hypothetical protein [Micromonospora echinofusca]SCG15530.1 hypothetical protein GA0070610_1764 [Micromonospora echinofusca]